MSDVLYPLGLISEIETSNFARVIRDEFEAGNTSSKLAWPAQFFKRRLKVRHAPLTAAEYKYLRSFYNARNGTYDSFWFRDNINRQGNLKVRFANTMLSAKDSDLNRIEFGLDEAAPIKRLPEFDDVVAAAGSAPLFWWDPNREYYLSHAGTVLKEASVYDQYLQRYPAVWQASSALSLGGTTSQYQTFDFTGTHWAKSATNVSEFSGTRPACSFFVQCRHGDAEPGASAEHVIAAVGGTGASLQTMGFALNDTNWYQPYTGRDQADDVNCFENDPVSTWRSFGGTWASTSAAWKIYVNGALHGSITEADRVYGAGPASLGGDSGGNLLVSAGSLSNNLGNVLFFAAELTLGQVTALHNLFAHQYGLATA